MTEAPLTGTDRKETLSPVRAKALAARAGYSVSAPRPDRDSADSRIQAGGAYRSALDLQLEATAGISEPRDGFIPFRLSVKNYNDLRVETQTPRLLVVLELPRDEVQWMSVTMEELVLRRRAYWLSLEQAHDEITDQQTVSVRIPERNVLNVETLQELMDRSRTGEI